MQKPLDGSRKKREPLATIVTHSRACSRVGALLPPVFEELRVEWSVVVSAVATAKRTCARKRHLEWPAAGEAAQQAFLVWFRHRHRLRDRHRHGIDRFATAGARLSSGSCQSVSVYAFTRHAGRRSICSARWCVALPRLPVRSLGISGRDVATDDAEERAARREPYPGRFPAGRASHEFLRGEPLM